MHFFVMVSAGTDLRKVWPGSARMPIERSPELDELITHGETRSSSTAILHYRVIVNFDRLTLLNAGTLKGEHRPGVSIFDLRTAASVRSSSIRTFRFSASRSGRCATKTAAACGAIRRNSIAAGRRSRCTRHEPRSVRGDPREHPDVRAINGDPVVVRPHRYHVLPPRMVGLRFTW